MPRFKLKITDEDPSKAIIQTFHPHWNELLLANRISVVFRKMGPRAFQPEEMYAYVSAPISAIVAKLPITSYEQLPLNDALSLADKGVISQSDLRAYADDYRQLLVIGVGPVEPASQPITYSTLSTEYGYFPSSTFIPLSSFGVATLDRLGQFRPCTAEDSKSKPDD